MFTILSNEAKLINVLQLSKAQEIADIKVNFEHVIQLLSVPTAELLTNRRQHGVLLPQSVENTLCMSFDSESPADVLSVLQKQSSIISYINSLCLTEAVIIKDNFDNCLELPIFKATSLCHPKATSSKTANETTSAIINLPASEEVAIVPPKAELKESVNNVSPIRINEVKNRLTQAIETSEQQKDEVKQKLNALLNKTTGTKTLKMPKQA